MTSSVRAEFVFFKLTKNMVCFKETLGVMYCVLWIMRKTKFKNVKCGGIVINQMLCSIDVICDDVLVIVKIYIYKKIYIV